MQPSLGGEAGFSAVHSYHLQYRFCRDPFPADWLPSPAFSSLQRRWCDLTKPSVCLSRLCNLFSLGGKFNPPSGLTAGDWALGPDALFWKEYVAWHLCHLSFRIWKHPNPWLGGPYCVFWLVFNRKQHVIIPQFGSYHASRVFTFVLHTPCAKKWIKAIIYFNL